MLNYNFEEIETPLQQIEAAIKEENYEKQREEMEEQPRLSNREAFIKAKESEKERLMDEQDIKDYLEFLKELKKVQDKGLGKHVKELEKNPYHKNKYFNIDTTTKLLQEGLKDTNIHYRFVNRYSNNNLFLDLLVTHTLNGYTDISTRKYYNFEKLEPQNHNASETYYKRQMLLSYFSIKGEKDDDGNSISPKQVLASLKSRYFELLEEKYNGTQNIPTKIIEEAKKFSMDDFVLAIEKLENE